MNYSILPIPAYTDNYIWLIIHSATQRCLIIDPGESTAVIQTLTRQKYIPTAVLLTHHHHDHSGGASELAHHFQLPVYGPAVEAIPAVTHPLHNATLLLPDNWDTPIRVFSIPGHTRGHLAYYLEGRLFCGDTLFTAGCGRIFEGTPAQMYQSLAILTTLPATTEIYCGHEYTLANLQFALTVEPTNTALQERLQHSRALRQQGLPTVPSTATCEQQTNPFLRCHEASVQTAVTKHFGTQFASELEVFTALREWKNSFKIS